VIGNLEFRDRHETNSSLSNPDRIAGSPWPYLFDSTPKSQFFGREPPLKILRRLVLCPSVPYARPSDASYVSARPRPSFSRTDATQGRVQKASGLTQLCPPKCGGLRSRGSPHAAKAARSIICRINNWDAYNGNHQHLSDESSRNPPPHPAPSATLQPTASSSATIWSTGYGTDFPCRRATLF